MRAAVEASKITKSVVWKREQSSIWYYLVQIIKFHDYAGSAVVLLVVALC
jgi:hypothetical protein